MTTAYCILIDSTDRLWGGKVQMYDEDRRWETAGSRHNTGMKLTGKN
ncbi:MAG: hypothetical protein M3Y85_00520 [Bacteroidota bacterium]|nr:hypothetical protein [Bacteroidota bacterium]